MATAASNGPSELMQARAEIARLRKKITWYQNEIADLRERLQESAYNEPESEVERMHSMEIDREEWNAPTTAPAAPPPPPPSYCRKLAHRFKKENVFVPLPWPPHPLLLLWAFVGSFTGIAALAALHQYEFLDIHFAGIIPSMGASAVLLYSATASPLAQPWNALCGHTTAAIVGVIIRSIFIRISWLKPLIWLACGLSVSISICLMQLLHALHPPAGATALIAIIGHELVLKEKWLFIVVPVLFDIFFLVVLAFFWDNFLPMMTYPTSWIPFGRKRQPPAAP